jgi:hypothetical protein
VDCAFIDKLERSKNRKLTSNGFAKTFTFFGRGLFVNKFKMTDLILRNY